VCVCGIDKWHGWCWYVFEKVNQVWVDFLLFGLERLGKDCSICKEYKLRLTAIVVVLLLWVDYVPIWYAMWSWWGLMDLLGKGIPKPMSRCI